jgi:hypothetical protein
LCASGHPNSVPDRLETTIESNTLLQGGMQSQIKIIPADVNVTDRSLLDSQPDFLDERATSGDDEVDEDPLDEIAKMAPLDRMLSHAECRTSKAEKPWDLLSTSVSFDLADDSAGNDRTFMDLWMPQGNHIESTVSIDLAPSRKRLRSSSDTCTSLHKASPKMTQVRWHTSDPIEAGICSEAEGRSLHEWYADMDIDIRRSLPS